MRLTIQQPTVKFTKTLFLTTLFALILCIFILSNIVRYSNAPLESLGPPNAFLGQQLHNQSSSGDIKILCWFFSMNTTSRQIKQRAVRETWGKRCDKLLAVFRGDRLEEVNGTLTVPIKEETRKELWHKASAAVIYVHDNYLNQYDWFVKCDDDSYLIVDSLKRFLAKSSPDIPIYFGHRYKPYVRQGYMSGGSGYAMSKRALHLLVDGISNGIDGCPTKGGTHEDVEMGHCFQAVGVQAGDSRDELGRETFLALSPMWLISQRKVDDRFWYNQYNYYGKPKAGKDCCSDRPISFHYIKPELMYMLDWLLYDVKRLD